MLAEKAIGFLVWYGHDRESIRVLLLNWAQKIIAGLQTRHHVGEAGAGWDSRERPLQPRLDSGDGGQILLIFRGGCQTLVRALRRKGGSLGNIPFHNPSLVKLRDVSFPMDYFLGSRSPTLRVAFYRVSESAFPKQLSACGAAIGAADFSSSFRKMVRTRPAK
jgi:hypothetical protein